MLRRRLAAVTLLLGMATAVPLCVLTPPFQAPDEVQQFARAYQVSEPGSEGYVSDGKAGAMLPSSLIEMAEHFLGRRDLFQTPTRSLAQPFSGTWRYRHVQLDTGRREFIDFRTALLYPPWSYAPQATAIALARAAGAGPLGLLWAARVCNAAVAVVLVAWAVVLAPRAKLAFMLIGLLPMALFEYGSAASDATTISTGLLYTAAILRVRARGCWTTGLFFLALVSACVFCVCKPVYAPSLLVAAPLLVGQTRRASVAGTQVALLAAVVAAIVL